MSVGSGHTALDQGSAAAAAGRHAESAQSVSAVAREVGRSFDPSWVGPRYADQGASLAAGIASATEAIARWSTAASALAVAVRVGVTATSEADDISARAIGAATP